jgi:hypothetical protein
MYRYFSLKVLLTPPDEGPRVKGQRIKLQDIIDGFYTPANMNNGCWISCKYKSDIISSSQKIHFHNFTIQPKSFFIKINGVK